MQLKNKRPGGRPARVTRADIIAEARKIPARDLSLSLIARRLGIKTPSLYNHFESRDALLSALSAELASELKVRPADPEHWREWLTATAGDVYKFYAANPAILEMKSSQLVANVIAPVMEAGLETLRRAGFKPVDALLVWSAVVGIAVLQAQSEQITPGNAGSDSAAAVQSRAHAGDKFSRVRESYAELSRRNSKTLSFDLLTELVGLFADPASRTESRDNKRRRT